MWGCNVSRLRGASFAVQQGLRRRWYGSANTAEPVSDEEFLIALKGVYPQRQWRTRKTIGLAISGGVDSMALATLYAKLLPTYGNLPQPHGIIIDHKVRPESTEEAEWVAEELRRNFDMKSTIVPLVWPADVDLNNLHRFETEARRLRYQALGLTCKDHGINSLLVAHHGDDQAETVMMRLIQGRHRSGLQGMHGVEWIPECHGLHGVHQSGDLPKGRSGDPKFADHMPYPIERGGIQILRPLLSFEKSRLIATCERNGTTWAEDKTNLIPTFTARNAVRHVVRNHKLPEALTKKALISLAQHMTDRIQSHKAAAEKIFNTSPLLLDMQTGSLIIRFPPASSFSSHPISTSSDKNLARNTAYLYLQRVSELISPRETPSIGQFSKAVDTIWPTLDTDPNPAPLPTNVCVFGIWYRPWGKQSPFDSTSGSETRPTVVNEMDYLLTRQPLDHHEKQVANIFLKIPPSRTDPQAKEKWHLFDGRFWIQLTNHTNDDMIIRTLDKHDLDASPTTTPEISTAWYTNPYAQRYLKAALSLLKPVDLRGVIPAVFWKPEALGGEEVLIGLPTLGASAADPSVDFRKEVCQWRVRYKKIDLGTRSAEDLVMSGLRTENVRREQRRLENTLRMKRKRKEWKEREENQGEKPLEKPFENPFESRKNTS